MHGKKMPESTDYKRFRRFVVLFGDRVDRVENILVNGMPDINFCADGVECWIEQKSPKEPRRPTTPLFGSNTRISQNQRNWFLRQCKAGGRCFFLICTDKRWLLIAGNMADKINEMTITELMKIALWHRMKPVIFHEWMELRQALRLGENENGSRPNQ